MNALNYLRDLRITSIVSAAVFLFAGFLLFAAHLIRAGRWALLFPPRYLPGRFELLLGLVIGYAVNAIIPLRLGEIVRSWYVSERNSIRFSYVAATVLAERLSDVVVVSVVSAAILIYTGGGSIMLPVIAAILAAVLIGLSIAVHRSKAVRRAIWGFSSVFNDRIRFAVVDFFWSFSDTVASGALTERRYVLATLIMWLVYGASYLTFSDATGGPLADSVYALLGSPLRPVVELLASGTNRAALLLLMFTGIPIVGVFAYTTFKRWSSLVRSFREPGRIRGFPSGHGLKALYDRFKTPSEYRFFLASLFSGDDQVVTRFGLQATEATVVHKLFNGGSDAITALVESQGNLTIRKFAAGAAGAKLKVQTDWLTQHQSKEMPLVTIDRTQQGEGFFFYDMPLIVPANDFYDVIHTSPAARSKEILTQVIERVSAFHRRHERGPASPEALTEYLSAKGAKNAESILGFARTVLPDADYLINGVPHSLGEWSPLSDLNWLRSQIKNDVTATIHGDLTIENLIIAPNQPLGWYIIDPNPENIFDSPMLDWAKLMQSLNLGYEGLNRGVSITLNGTSIHLPFTKSQVYSGLHSHLEAWLADRYGAETLREIYFHELIHYLRLTPYKIRQDAKKGLAFFACTSLLVRRYMQSMAA